MEGGRTPYTNFRMLYTFWLSLIENNGPAMKRCAL